MQRTVNLVLLVAVAGFCGSAQQISSRGNAFREPPANTTIRLDANLVLVPVTVTDSRGRVVPNLLRTDFTLLEEKRPQNILSVSRENAPVSLGIVVDLSGSMANKIRATHTAVNEFLKNLEPDDEELLVTFADRPELRLPFTSVPSELYDALAGAAPHGSTALFDAVALAIRQMRGARNQSKVLFLVSDGGDNHSRLTEHELRRLVEEEDVQIHAIGIHDTGAGMDKDETRGPLLLEDLAQMTGGQHYMVRDAEQLPELAAKMSLALHDRYLIGYRPTPPGPSGLFQRIEVRVAQPKGNRLSVYARRGYRMP
jgi:Ca-activated chloride channel family protein